MDNLNPPQELLRKIAELTEESKQAVNGSITEVVGGWLAAEYIGAAHGKLAGADGAHRWEILRACVQDWTKLRRSDQVSARMELTREQMDRNRAQSETEKEKEFREWVKRPEIREELLGEARARQAAGTN